MKPNIIILCQQPDFSKKRGLDCGVGSLTPGFSKSDDSNVGGGSSFKYE